MTNPYRPAPTQGARFFETSSTLAAQKRKTSTDSARLLHALALMEEALTSLAPLVQEQAPHAPCNRAYALLTDASADVRTLLQEGNR